MRVWRVSLCGVYTYGVAWIVVVVVVAFSSREQQLGNSAEKEEAEANEEEEKDARPCEQRVQKIFFFRCC